MINLLLETGQVQIAVFYTSQYNVLPYEVDMSLKILENCLRSSEYGIKVSRTIISKG